MNLNIIKEKKTIIHNKVTSKTSTTVQVSHVGAAQGFLLHCRFRYALRNIHNVFGKGKADWKEVDQKCILYSDT